MKVLFFASNAFFSHMHAPRSDLRWCWCHHKNNALHFNVMMMSSQTSTFALSFVKRLPLRLQELCKRCTCHLFDIFPSPLNIHSQIKHSFPGSFLNFLLGFFNSELLHKNLVLNAWAFGYQRFLCRNKTGQMKRHEVVVSPEIFKKDILHVLFSLLRWISGGRKKQMTSPWLTCLVVNYISRE